jgi:hypothetical protein
MLVLSTKDMEALLEQNLNAGGIAGYPGSPNGSQPAL